MKRDNAIWMSPDGSKVVYATFNDSLVQEVRWKIYGNPDDAIVDPYPKEGMMRYPKVTFYSYIFLNHVECRASGYITNMHNSFLMCATLLFAHFYTYYSRFSICLYQSVFKK